VPLLVSRQDGYMEENVIKICRELIQIDSRNWGLGKSSGESDIAQYVINKLQKIGLNPASVGPDSKRTSVLCELKGSDENLAKVLIHAHLDVVPFDEADWSFHPLSAEIANDTIYGRGAVDMKNGVAMILATLEELIKNNFQPRATLLFAFFADEEAGGLLGSHWVVDHHKDFFHGAKYAVGEVGGFSTSLADGIRMYLIETAQKGIAWMELNAKGSAGHGSMINSDNAVSEVAAAVNRIANHKFPLTLHESVLELLRETAEITGTNLDVNDPEATANLLQGLEKIVKATLRDTANPTMLNAGYKANVIPGFAQAVIDGRFLPGNQESFLQTIKDLAGEKVDVKYQNLDVALSAPFEDPLVGKMVEAISVEDPAARVVPYMLSGGTDAKALSKLNITGYGFMPLQLPSDLDFASLFHGVNERIPISSLQFGVRTFKRFLMSL